MCDDLLITPGSIVIAVGILFAGIFLARRISRIIRRRALARLKMPEGTLTAYQSLIFYVLLIFVAFFALSVSNIPLTAFTVIGGALAIGVGLGSQNLVKNLMSGIALLVEQPIRVGDMVEVDGILGTVESVGARSTRIRTFTNTHIIVPNSSFLENNVINWTLSDEKIRVCVTVGVAYGSPMREATRFLRTAAEGHGRILKNPKPIVLFTEFGDNALHLEVHFWIRMKTVMDRRTIESDMRFAIERQFHNAGIVIAFPQRDVHLDSVKPLEVRLLRESNEAEPAEAAKG